MTFPLKKHILCALLFCLYFSSNAQERATITGIVYDQFGILPGAKVGIEGYDITTLTDVNGVYTFKLEEGDYILTANLLCIILCQKM